MPREPAPLPSPEVLLGGLTVEEFLDRYWQKQPLLIRQAFPGFSSPLSPEELAGLACEDEVESRLVRERDESGPWALRHGPFTEADFAALPPTHWTLLVQDAEKHVPALARLLEPFRFIPDWRIDDLMISYAAPQGSVGPHVDQYDVFLLQACGHRRWQIAYPAPVDERLIPGLALRILEHFEPTHDWLLAPGDMLYLPPGVPHHGVAQDACMTYSIGFRAPSARELLAGVLDEVLAAAPERRYADPDLRPQPNPGELVPAALAGLRQLVREALTVSDAQLNGWIARALSETKPGFADKAAPRRISKARLRERLAGGAMLRRNPAARFVLLRASPDRACLFVDGERFALEGSLVELGARLAAETVLAPSTADRDDPALELLLALVNNDQLELTRAP